ncbi:MAG TPA: hypothetical protein VG826_09205 [Pirellulales bacterium]|nr:hypothetical protein [Pirellulales bacterium]
MSEPISKSGRPQSSTRFSTLVSAAITIAALICSAASANAEFTPIAGWDHQLFPSYLIATAAIRSAAAEDDAETDDDSDENGEEGVEILGDRRGVLGVQVQSPSNDAEITVTITGNEIMEESTFSATLETEGAVYLIFPRIKYKYAALATNKQSIPVSVTFEVEIDDEEAESETEIVTLRSVNDCPFTIAHADGTFTDVSFTFAAYVNEQHPFVDKVLREALNSGIVDSFTGYQSGDAAEVYRQVYAIWNALSERDVRYSNITTSAAESSVVASQHVRLIDESINNAQANCVDGSVLLASLLRKIDIEPMLVFVPGHCYLAFYLDEGQKQLVGLETTLIGSEADGSTSELPGVDSVVDGDWREANSWGTFCAAVAMGSKDLAENKEKFNDPADADYQLIPIAGARRQGILPISFNSADRFESAAN